MKKLLIIIVCIIVILTACSEKNTDVLKDKKQDIVTDISKELTSDYMLDEDLRDSQGEIYRCSYNANTDDFIIHPIIRIEVLDDGTGILNLAVYTCLFSDDKFSIAEELKRNLSKKQIEGLLSLIEKNDFWNIGEYEGKINPTNPPSFINIDAIKDGKYQSVDRVFSPSKSIADIYDLFKYFIELCGDTEHYLKDALNLEETIIETYNLN